MSHCDNNHGAVKNLTSWKFCPTCGADLANGSTAPACSASAYETEGGRMWTPAYCTYVKGSKLTMKFRSSDEACAFFDAWMDTLHKIEDQNTNDIGAE